LRNPAGVQTRGAAHGSTHRRSRPLSTQGRSRSPAGSTSSRPARRPCASGNPAPTQHSHPASPSQVKDSVTPTWEHCCDVSGAHQHSWYWFSVFDSDYSGPEADYLGSAGIAVQCSPAPRLVSNYSPTPSSLFMDMCVSPFAACVHFSPNPSSPFVGACTRLSLLAPRLVSLTSNPQRPVFVHRPTRRRACMSSS